ncbi:MAG: hypothetical protein ACR2P2_01555 [Nakamurella sp.]
MVRTRHDGLSDFAGQGSAQFYETAERLASSAETAFMAAKCADGKCTDGHPPWVGHRVYVAFLAKRIDFTAAEKL